MRLRSTLSTDRVQYYKAKAQEEFPALGADEALTAYSELHSTENLFFHDKDGKRYVWRADLEYSANIISGTKEICCGSNRYLIRLSNTNKLASINRPKNTELLKIVAHSNEVGWNLPTDHKTHFLKFPAEILNAILRYALVLEPYEELRPITNNSNLKKKLVVPDYQTIQEYWDLLNYSSHIRGPFMSWTEMQDAEGSYTELRHIYRKPIDATLLRVDKIFNRVGSSMLYGDNTFSLPMTPNNCEYTPWSNRRIGTRETIHNPLSEKIDLWNAAVTRSTVTEGVNAIRQGASIYELPGWLYHDRFLRFLHTIGPKNVALIRTLKFRGTVLLHTCEGQEGHEYCDDDLVLMTTLVRVIIGMILNPWKTHCDLFLEEQIMQVRSLRSLQVVEHEWHNTFNPEFAKPTIARLLARTKARIDAAATWDSYFKELKREREQKPQLEDSKETGEDGNLICDFCGEEHNWTECWNLCNLCGEFGHFRKGCLRVDEE